MKYKVSYKECIKIIVIVCHTYRGDLVSLPVPSQCSLGRGPGGSPGDQAEPHCQTDPWTQVGALVIKHKSKYSKTCVNIDVFDWLIWSIDLFLLSAYSLIYLLLISDWLIDLLL